MTVSWILLGAGVLTTVVALALIGLWIAFHHDYDEWL